MNGLLGALLGGNLGASRNLGLTPYKSHLGVTDGDTAYNTEAKVVALIGAVGVWTKIWQKTVEAQTQYRYGFGSPAYPHNQGYMYFVICAETTDYSIGVVRLAQAKAREQLIVPVLEVDDTRLRKTEATAANITTETSTPSNINEMMALPEKVEYKKIGEDSLIQIWYRLITAATVADAVAFSIPVTIYQ